MKVSQVCARDVASCAPETDLARAGGLMWERDCGVLPVVGPDGKVIGVITDRDICIAVSTRTRVPSDIQVRDVMSEHLYCCRWSDTVRDALRTMRKHRVLRLPVVDSRGRLRGLLSMTDLLTRARPDHVGELQELTYEDVMLTLQTISASRAKTARKPAPAPKSLA